VRLEIEEGHDTAAATRADLAALRAEIIAQLGSRTESVDRTEDTQQAISSASCNLFGYCTAVLLTDESVPATEVVGAIVLLVVLCTAQAVLAFAFFDAGHLLSVTGQFPAFADRILNTNFYAESSRWGLGKSNVAITVVCSFISAVLLAALWLQGDNESTHRTLGIEPRTSRPLSLLSPCGRRFDPYWAGSSPLSRPMCCSTTTRVWSVWASQGGCTSCAASRGVPSRPHSSGAHGRCASSCCRRARGSAAGCSSPPRAVPSTSLSTQSLSDSCLSSTTSCATLT